MKMKNVLLSLSLAGLCFSQAAAQDIPHSSSAMPAARHIGDGVRSIGDTNRVVDNRPDERPESFIPTESDTSEVTVASNLDMQILAPTASRMKSRRTQRSSCSPARTWFTAETLLWFSDNQPAPPLVTTSASGVLPVAGGAGVTTQFGGGTGIEHGLLPGYRLGGGMYIDDCQKIGVGGRIFGIYSDNERYDAASNGTTSIGIPFFNSDFNVNAEDAYLVAFTNGANQLVSEGSVRARVDLDMLSADGSIHILLGKSNDHRFDLLAGYTYSRLKSSVSLGSTSINRFTGDLIPDGTIFTTEDLFETENTFNGAHLGVLSSIVRNRINLTTLAKISFGNMRQRGSIGGYTLEEFGGTTTQTSGGIFSQNSNIGAFSQDVFAFIPELGIKLGYSVRDNIDLTVGYTFLFWSSVGMAGAQMDRSVDLTQVTARPSFQFMEDSFWMQGIDLGATIRF